MLFYFIRKPLDGSGGDGDGDGDGNGVFFLSLFFLSLTFRGVICDV